jgi:hypothetical protein
MPVIWSIRINKSIIYNIITTSLNSVIGPLLNIYGPYYNENSANTNVVDL